MVILVEGYNYKNASFWGGPIIMQFIDFLGIYPSTKMAITPLQKIYHLVLVPSDATWHVSRVHKRDLKLVNFLGLLT